MEDKEKEQNEDELYRYKNCDTLACALMSIVPGYLVICVAKDYALAQDLPRAMFFYLVGLLSVFVLFRRYEKFSKWLYKKIYKER